MNMANLKPRTVLFRRKREQKTDYQNRLKLLLSKQFRLVVRFTNSRIIAQVVEFQMQGDRILMALDSSALRKAGWNYSLKNFPAAYLTGLLLGKKAQERGIKQAILDPGTKAPLKKSKVYAFLKGIADSGLSVPHGDKEIFPGEDRLSGKHISDYARQLEGKKEYEARFNQYLKNKHLPEDITKAFAEAKQKILVLK